jgi:hypothetical protein
MGEPGKLEVKRKFMETVSRVLACPELHAATEFCDFSSRVGYRAEDDDTTL